LKGAAPPEAPVFRTRAGRHPPGRCRTCKSSPSAPGVTSNHMQHDTANPGARTIDTLEGRMISLTGVSKQYGRQILFVDASFQLNPGETVGLVGPNGSGKTTLFRLITGEEVPDEGEISIPKKLTVGYFRQDVEE